jgi:hypothetical protein
MAEADEREEPENSLIVMERVKSPWPENVRFLYHAIDQMRKRRIDANDISQAISGGFVSHPRWEKGCGDTQLKALRWMAGGSGV